MRSFKKNLKPFQRHLYNEAFSERKTTAISCLNFLSNNVWGTSEISAIFYLYISIFNIYVSRVWFAKLEADKYSETQYSKEESAENLDSPAHR